MLDTKSLAILFFSFTGNTLHSASKTFPDQDHPHEKDIQKKREAKGKGDKERYTHLNAEFQRIAMRDKKAFLRDQCKEIEENNRMGKTRDLFKKIRDTKGIFHVMMGTKKDRYGMDLTEAEDIKKRSKNTQKNCTKKYS